MRACGRLAWRQVGVVLPATSTSKSSAKLRGKRTRPPSPPQSPARQPPPLANDSRQFPDERRPVAVPYIRLVRYVRAFGIYYILRGRHPRRAANQDALIFVHAVNHFEYAHRMRSTTFCCRSSPDRMSTSSSISTKKSWKMRRGRMPPAAWRSR